MGVKSKRFSQLIELDDKGRYMAEYSEIRRVWMLENGITRMEETSLEVVDWDKTKMRNYFHGVIIPWFVEKFTLSQSAHHYGVFNFDLVREFIKAKFIGFVPTHKFELWAPIFRLKERPEDIQDWIRLKHQLLELKIWGHFELQSTEALSAESYWNLINSCEGYALSLFDDIYPLSRKPEKPESEVISD